MESTNKILNLQKLPAKIPAKAQLKVALKVANRRS